MMRRRDFITLLGGAAATWPLAALAQQPAMPLVGVLLTTTGAPLVPPFQQGLKETGFVEGRNVAVEYHYQPADRQSHRAAAADLVGRQASVIVTFTGDAALAARDATSSIPIVFGYGADPIRLGLVTSFNRPGGNMTGVTLTYTDLLSKRVELLREFVPRAAAIGMLEYPDRPGKEDSRKEMENLALGGGWRLHAFSARTEGEIDAAFASASREQVGGVVVQGGPFFFGRGEQFAALETRYRMPAIFTWRDIPAVGGLMSYGISLAEMYRLVGVYAGRVLKGDKPADLPVQVPTKFELVINLKTAKALDLTVPATLLASADEVIE